MYFLTRVLVHKFVGYITTSGSQNLTKFWRTKYFRGGLELAYVFFLFLFYFFLYLFYFFQFFHFGHLVFVFIMLSFCFDFAHFHFLIFLINFYVCFISFTFHLIYVFKQNQMKITWLRTGILPKINHDGWGLIYAYTATAC